MEKAKTLLEIARIISGNDDDVLAEIEESIDNIEVYVQEHLEEFEERNISIKYDSVEDLQWLVTVNILVRNNYVMQIQEDCSITDFGWSLKSLRTFKEYNLALDSKFEEEDYEIDKYDYNEDDEYDYYNEEMDFIDDENIINWCKYLDSKWFDEDICIGMIDLSPDIFTLFLASEENLEDLEDLADSLGKVISTVY